MSIDKLQEKIRKFKNPLVVDFSFRSEHIPGEILERNETFIGAYKEYCLDLLDGLKDVVPAVRFNFSIFALMGDNGLETLAEILRYAKDYGYYVLLDSVETLSAQSAEFAAETLLGSETSWCFDGLITTAYIGSDALRPYIARLKDSGKALFVVARTANRSAPELQDLLTGSRLAHLAVVDHVNRFAESLVSRSGYSQVGVVSGASSADSLRTLRAKYKSIFLLLDGADYPNANAKNCSFAFDRLGHGAAACTGLSVIAAWQEVEGSGEYVKAAVQAAVRYRKNLTRYITVL